MEKEYKLPLTVYSGKWGKNHCQGIAVDLKNKFMYFSFTTLLVKTDLKGKVVGTVIGIIGHLGCISFNPLDGKVYASLEYKNDAIGRGILNTLSLDKKLDDSFYLAVFDGGKINRTDMDAVKDGIMKTVYLSEPAGDYAGVSAEGKQHRYGCSGIDGLAIGPDFGGNKDKNYLYVCYGVYGDESRQDNDYNIILQYDFTLIKEREEDYKAGFIPKSVLNCRNKFFVYTGNTIYGIQNLEYDSFTGNYFMAVYRGIKKNFTDFSMFIIDGGVKPEIKELKGLNLKGNVLTLAKEGIAGKNGIYGSFFPYGSTGIFSIGDGKFYFSENGGDKDGFFTNAVLYRYIGGETTFEKVV